MLLYQDPRAPNPRRVRVFLAEKGVAYDTIEVLIADKAHQTPEFRKKNPLQLLPVLEMGDGRVLRESIAICRYVEETHPEPNLFGVDAWERAQVEMWNRHAELEVFWPIMQIFRNTNKFWEGKIKQSPDFAAIMREQLGERLDWIEGELGKRDFLASDRYTVADITAMCGIDFGKVIGLRLTEDTRPNLFAWHKRVSERPSAKA